MERPPELRRNWLAPVIGACGVVTLVILASLGLPPHIWAIGARLMPLPFTSRVLSAPLINQHYSKPGLHATTVNDKEAENGDLQGDENYLAEDIVAGHVIRLTPSPERQIHDRTCKSEGFARSATIGPSKLPVLFESRPNSKPTAENPLSCELTVSVLNQVIIGDRPSSHALFGAGVTSLADESNQYAWIGAYLVGPPPYALLLAGNGYSGGNGDSRWFSLFMERRGKLVELLAGSAEAIDAQGNQIMLTTYYRTPDDCMACGSDEKITFALNSLTGRFKYQLLTRNADKALRALLMAATPEGAAQLAKEWEDATQASYAEARNETGPRSPAGPGATCMDYIKARRQAESQPYVSYVIGLLEQFDIKNVARGCLSVLGNETQTTMTSALDKVCAREPEQTLYQFAQSNYGARRAISQLGFGGDCRR